MYFSNADTTKADTTKQPFETVIFLRALIEPYSNNIKIRQKISAAVVRLDTFIIYLFHILLRRNIF